MYRPVASGAVEGLLDEVVLYRLAEHAGISLGAVFGGNGKTHLRDSIAGYNQAARFSPWIVLVDLDHDECAPSLCARWLPTPAEHMCLRVAVREIESWLLADRTGIAAFLGVPASRVPSVVDDLDDPKQTLVDLARRSRRRAIREDMAPRHGSGLSIGPAYTSRMMEFVGVEGPNRWRPDVAAQTSPSLSRCMKALEQLRDTALPERSG